VQITVDVLKFQYMKRNKHHKRQAFLITHTFYCANQVSSEQSFPFISSLGMIVMDGAGRVAAGTTTNGANHKIPGYIQPYTCHVLGRVTIFRICNFVFFCILNLTPIQTLNLTLTPSLTLILIITLILSLIQTLILTLKV
jgi:hypothetical protein